MDNNELFDYYNNSFSYLKIIMNNLNDDKKDLEIFVVKDIFNEIVNDMDSSKIYEMLIISSLFEKKLNELSENSKEKMINDMYSCYIKPMILNYINNEDDMVKHFFNSLNNKIISISGFYGIFGDNLDIFHENINKSR